MIDEALARNNLRCKGPWSKRLAVGSHEYVAGFQAELKAGGKGSHVLAEESGFFVCEGLNNYGAYFDYENRAIEQKAGDFQG